MFFPAHKPSNSKPTCRDILLLRGGGDQGGQELHGGGGDTVRDGVQEQLQHHLQQGVQVQCSTKCSTKYSAKCSAKCSTKYKIQCSTTISAGWSTDWRRWCRRRSSASPAATTPPSSCRPGDTAGCSTKPSAVRRCRYSTEAGPGQNMPCNKTSCLAFQSTASRRMRLFARQLLRRLMNGNVTHIMRKFVRRM